MQHSGKSFSIMPMAATDAKDWVAMRTALWPEGDAAEHAAEIMDLLAKPDQRLNLIARDRDGTTLGFAEVSVRHDYVNGCITSPVAFLEGIYVLPAARRSGVGRALVAAVEQWAKDKGYSELASDALIENGQSQMMHAALDFEETERVVYFRKRLS